MKGTCTEWFNRSLLLFFLLGIALTTLPSPAQATKLFGSDERKSRQLRSFPKWTDVLDRYDNEVTARSRCGFTQCPMPDWNSFLEMIKDKPFLTILKEVNRYLNKKPYIIDPVNWGVADYWETPREFNIKSGDCEDYAISKYMSLKALGFDDERMRIVVLMDHNLGIHHAVLAVEYNGKNYILDNQIETVVEDSQIYHYQPIYSINEHAWWRHR